METLNFVVIGSAIFLKNDVELSELNETEQTSVNIKVDFSHVKEDVENQYLYASIYGNGLVTNTPFPKDEEQDIGVLNVAAEEVEVESEQNIKNNNEYALIVQGVSPDTNDYTTRYFAEGRFSIIDGVACYSPDIVPLEFGCLKNAMIRLCDKVKALETKLANITETLDGYTTE